MRYFKFIFSLIIIFVLIQNGKIYIAGAIDSGSIHVYDKAGENIKIIQPPLDKVPFTDKDKQSWIDSYTSNDEYKRQYERMKKFFAYPDFFPLFKWAPLQLFLHQYTKLSIK